MRVLVAISSCEQYERDGLNAPSRETWLSGMDYRFFHGQGASPKDDVVLVNCNDEYHALTDKLKLKLRYALENSYDFCFCCFPDTYAVPERLLSCGFESSDYMGNVFCHPGGTPYAQGGPGFFLRRRAMEVLVNDPSSYQNEDCWAGDTLAKHGIYPVDHLGFTNLGPGPLKTNSSITVHLSTQPGGYTGANMRAAHQDWINSCLRY